MLQKMLIIRGIQRCWPNRLIEIISKSDSFVLLGIQLSLAYVRIISFSSIAYEGVIINDWASFVLEFDKKPSCPSQITSIFTFTVYFNSNDRAWRNNG
ncbi:hypothetical protein D3C73_616960 [compost metagenome]